MVSAKDFSAEELLNYFINSPYRYDENFTKYDVFKKREIIKAKYDKIRSYIFENKSSYVNPYIVPWESVLNANETNLFHCFRASGFPMYPQFPVGKYWVDFGNPFYKVAIEADSKTFHTIEKDIDRDFDLKKMGWTVYHIPSSLSFSKKQVDVYNVYRYDENYVETWEDYLRNTLEGVLDCIYSHVTGRELGYPEELEGIIYEVQQKYLLI